MKLSRVSSFFLLLALFGATAVSAQFTLPTSDKLLEVNVSYPGGEAAARVEARQGTMITVRSEKTRTWYGFVLMPEGLDPEKVTNLTAVVFDLVPEGNNSGVHAKEIGHKE